MNSEFGKFCTQLKQRVCDLLQLQNTSEIFEQSDNKHWNRPWTAFLSHSRNKSLGWFTCGRTADVVTHGFW